MGTLGAEIQLPAELPVHPHTRGDICSSSPSSPSKCGSPPHAWGHSMCSPRHMNSYRFTPTRVGTFGLKSRRSLVISVHPHTRGDIPLYPISSANGIGSPPHAWGHCKRPLQALVHLRFTPTRVGTLHDSPCGTTGSPVHPHTRGDIAACSALRAPAYRFTPTRVGTFGCDKCLAALLPVHPHTRGDIGLVSLFSPSTVGSPPHAWGHWQRHQPSARQFRFTPTRVGTFGSSAPSETC